MTAYNNHAYPNWLFDMAFTIGIIGLIMIKTKTNNRYTCSVLLPKICCFLELYMLPVVTDVLERQQIIFRNWYVVFKALSLLESGNKFQTKTT